MPIIRALLYAKTAWHCALYNELQQIQLLIVASYFWVHSPNDVCKYLPLALMAIAHLDQ